MRGKGVSRDHSQPGTFSGKKTLKSCKLKGNIDNVVLIDVDSDEFHNVVIIDVPESLQQKLRGSRVLKGDKKFPFRGVISIDDDESNEVDLPGTSVEGGDDLDSDATSSKRSSPASEILRNSLDSDGAECRVIREKKSAFMLSKCKQTNSEKAPCRNHYGLYHESESGSSDSDCSDCEIMEGSFGKFREQWEKASQRRKYDVRNGQSGLDDEASASGCHSDTHQNAAVENRTEQHTEAHVCSTSSNTNLGKENASTSFATGDGYEGGASLNAGMGTSFVESKHKVDQERFSRSRSGSTEKTQFSYFMTDVQFRRETVKEHPSFSYAESQNYKHVNGGGTGSCNVELSPEEPSLWSNQELGDKQQNHATSCFQDKEQNTTREHCCPNSPPGLNIHFDHMKASVQDEGASLGKNQHLGETHVNHDRVVLMDKDKEFSRAPSSHKTSLNESQYNRTSFNGKGESVSPNHMKDSVQDEGATLGKNQHLGKTHVNHDRVVLMDKDEEFSRTPSSHKTSLNESEYNRPSFNEKGESVSGEPLVSDPRPSDETNIDCEIAAPEDKVGAVPEEPLVSDPRPSDETNIDCEIAAPEDKVGAVPEESFFCNTPSTGMSEVNNEKVDHQEKEKPDSEEISLCNSQCNETQIKQGTSCLAEANESFISSTSNSQRDPLHGQDGEVTPAVKVDIINEREKLKETDEYKQAVEEEWASRQRQLQIQAEEAHRLRKKRKAESMRLLDMERRQKQRVEEMRETQKKDEENMNLKEQLRAEIRKDLNKLEVRCIDMASVLRGLGIHVGGGLYPLSHEVHAAYKRAVLRFHPDRASRADIRLQVEAEEKFKLISRMKEKFLSTSCY